MFNFLSVSFEYIVIKSLSSIFVTHCKWSKENLMGCLFLRGVCLVFYSWVPDLHLQKIWFLRSGKIDRDICVSTNTCSIVYRGKNNDVTNNNTCSVTCFWGNKPTAEWPQPQSFTSCYLFKSRIQNSYSLFDVICKSDDPSLIL